MCRLLLDAAGGLDRDGGPMTFTTHNRLDREDTMPTTPSVTAGRRSWWLTAAWAGLLLFGAFNMFAAVMDLVATAGSGLPSDHTSTFAKVAGTTWSTVKAAQPGTARYVTLLERGYALHELTFAILFLAIVAVPFRARQRWSWWTCWALLIAYAGYALTFGAHDPAILPRSLIGLVGLPVLLLVHLPAFFHRSEG
jgi:hypothetical protein